MVQFPLLVAGYHDGTDVSRKSLNFQPRITEIRTGSAIVGSRHLRSSTPFLRAIPRRAISFAWWAPTRGQFNFLVVQPLMGLVSSFLNQPAGGVPQRHSTNYLSTNALNLRFQRQKGAALRGPLKFSWSASLPVLRTGCGFGLLQPRSATGSGPLARILAVPLSGTMRPSPRFVWNTPLNETSEKAA